MLSYSISDASADRGYAYLDLESQIKPYLAVDASGYDVLLEDLYFAASEYVEKITKQGLRDIDITVYYDSDEKYIELPYKPVTSITSITAISASGTETVITENNGYTLNGILGSRDSSIVLDVTESYDQLKVVYNCAGDEDVPYPIRVAVLGWLKVLFDDNRQFAISGQNNKVIPPKETIDLLKAYIPIAI